MNVIEGKTFLHIYPLWSAVESEELKRFQNIKSKFCRFDSNISLVYFAPFIYLQNKLAVPFSLYSKVERIGSKEL